MTLSELIGDSNLFELINRNNQFPWLTAENCASLNTLLLARFGESTVVKNMERLILDMMMWANVNEDILKKKTIGIFSYFSL